MTSLATGAANCAPCPGTSCSVTAIATRGCDVGANATNQTLLIVLPICVWAVPVLPATVTPGICAAVPVPSLTTASIILVTAVAVEGFMTTDCTRGATVCTVRPSGLTTRSVRWGTISVPWFATAAATSAICSGVTSSLSWPIPMRPTSTSGLVGASRRAPRYSPLADISSAGIVQLRLAVEAEAVHVAGERALAQAFGDLGVDRVDGMRERLREGDLAEALIVVVLQRHARDEDVVAPAQRRFGRVRAGVDGGAGGDDLESRAGGVAELGGAIDQRRCAVAFERFGMGAGAQGVGVKARRGGHHGDRAAAWFDCDDRAAVSGQGGVCEPLGAGDERRDHLVALRLLALQLVEDRLQVRFFLLSVELRCCGTAPGRVLPTLGDERVADRRGELHAFRIGALVGTFGPAHAAREHGSVGGKDRAAVDALLLEHGAHVERCFRAARMLRRSSSAR